MSNLDNINLNNINLAILKKTNEDGTIILGGGVTDCNKNVSQSSISLRELIIYSDIADETKEKLQNILLQYGMMFEGDEKRLYDIKDDLETLLGYGYVQQVDAYEYDLLGLKNESTIDEIGVMEKIIEKLLITYYKPYNIPNEHYDDIVYQHKGYDKICDKIKHHQKCLRNPHMNWNEFSTNKYDITVTVKDIKRLIFQARDSGGNMDCFGYANDGTTTNCVNSFVADKLGLEIENGFYFKEEDKERDKICQDIYEIVVSHMNDFLVSIY